MDENIDILGISETGLFSGISDNEITGNGYSMFRSDRNYVIKKHEDGILFYVRDELNPILIPVLCESGFKVNVGCSIKCKNNYIIVGVVFRAPDWLQINDDTLYELLNKLYNKRVLVVGDLTLLN